MKSQQELVCQINKQRDYIYSLTIGDKRIVDELRKLLSLQQQLYNAEKKDGD